MANTLLEQSIQYQERQIAELEARQAVLDAQSNELGALWNSARRALNDARNNPDTSQETLNQLQQNYDLVSRQRATINDNAQSNSDKILRLREALDRNRFLIQDPQNNVSFITEQNTTSDPGTNAQVNQQQQIQLDRETGAIPPGQSATPDEPAAYIYDNYYPEDEEGGAISPYTQDDINDEPVAGFVYNEDGELIPADSIDVEPRDYNQEISPDSDPAIPTGRFDTATADDIAGNFAGASSPGPDISTVSVQNPSPISGRSTAQSAPARQNETNYGRSPDWRFRIALAPSSKYLYNDPQNILLSPLKNTGGVLFPYTPTVQVNYVANYDNVDLAHTNYKFYTYRNSAVEAVAITADFTAQDTTQASYVLAVIHFFRSVTKMFYGLDQNPIRGTPPPLVYLNGFGNYHFDNHPGLVSSFTYTYPNDVDYISTGQLPISFNTTQLQKTQSQPAISPSIIRLLGGGLQPGAASPPPRFGNRTATAIVRKDNETRIPVKLTMNLTVLPIVTRQDISNNFSLREYANGSLMLGSQRRGGGGGIW